MKKKSNVEIIIIIGLLMLITSFERSYSSTFFSRNLKAAYFSVDITPSDPKMLFGYEPRISTGVLDRIFHKIVILNDGASLFILVSTDVCLFSPSEYDEVADLIQKKLGIPPLNFWWSVTHTHSAPEFGSHSLSKTFMKERFGHSLDTQYTKFIRQSLLQGVESALKRLEPVRLGVGWGFSRANINRRTWGKDRRAIFGMRPDGAVDRRIGLLRIERLNGTILALIANYPIHGTVLGADNLRISGDLPGNVASYVEKKLTAPLVFINGAAGNLAPIYSVYPDPYSGHLDQFNVLLGDKIIRANTEILNVYDSVKFSFGEIVVKTPRKSNLTNWPSDLNKYSSKSKDNDTYLINLPIRFFRINNNICIWSAPVEMFCEISNKIRDRSPYPFTFYFGYTNGWLGYLPTEADWENGGYEIQVVSPFSMSAEKDVTERILNYILPDPVQTESIKH